MDALADPSTEIRTGYAHSLYAASLAEFGRPRCLPRCGGWLLERAIPGCAARDARGLYPLFVCRDWRQLPADIAELSEQIVSLVLVADPFGNHNPALLTRTFNCGAIPFKDHRVIDLSQPIERSICAHHRRNARKALRRLHVERMASPVAALDDWCRLYDTLIRRHDIRGIRAFSRTAFAKQLAVPGLVAFRAERDGETVGMLLWYVHGDVGYYHLGAFSERGYEWGASFALFWTALVELARELRWLDLGADAGLSHDAGSGLSRFKRGWATGTRTAYLCRHVGDAERYAELCGLQGGSDDFFPAYRGGVDA